MKHVTRSTRYEREDSKLLNNVLRIQRLIDGKIAKTLLKICQRDCFGEHDETLRKQIKLQQNVRNQNKGNSKRDDRAEQIRRFVEQTGRVRRV